MIQCDAFQQNAFQNTCRGVLHRYRLLTLGCGG